MSLFKLYMPQRVGLLFVVLVFVGWLVVVVGFFSLVVTLDTLVFLPFNFKAENRKDVQSSDIQQVTESQLSCFIFPYPAHVSKLAVYYLD